MLGFFCIGPIRWSTIGLGIREARFPARGSAFSPVLSEAGWLASVSEQWGVSRWAGGWAVAGRAGGVPVGLSEGGPFRRGREGEGAKRSARLAAEKRVGDHAEKCLRWLGWEVMVLPLALGR